MLIAVVKRLSDDESSLGCLRPSYRSEKQITVHYEEEWIGLYWIQVYKFSLLSLDNNENLYTWKSGFLSGLKSSE